MLVEQPDLFDHALIELTPFPIGHLAHVPALELRNVPGVELNRTSLLLNPDGILRQSIQDSAHPSGSVGMVKLSTQYSSFLLGAWE
jgi:hypothetical protein